MLKHSNVMRVFSVVWIAAGLVNGVRGDWLGLALGLALGVGMLFLIRAAPNAQDANTPSPMLQAGIGFGFFGLTLMVCRIAADIVTKLLR